MLKKKKKKAESYKLVKKSLKLIVVQRKAEGTSEGYTTHHWQSEDFKSYS